LDRPLTNAEKVEVFDVFYRLGLRMQLTGLPANFKDWQQMRAEHLQQNLANSTYSYHLYQQYKKHLGWLRYMLLIKVQGLLVPSRVSDLLDLGKPHWIKPLLQAYRFLRRLKIESPFRNILLPAEYKVQIIGMDAL